MVKPPPELYPFESHFLKLESQHQLHYIDEGREHELSFVMLHGNPSWSFLYRHWVEALKGQVRCVVPDHLGCGLSDKPQDHDYHLQDHIDNALQLVNQLQLKNIVLVVHDWGGAIGMGLAMQLGQRLKGVIINNTAAFPDADIPKRIAICKTAGLGTFINRGLNGFAKAAITMAMPKGHSMSLKVAEGFLAPYGNWHDRVAIDAFIKDIPMDPQHRSRATLEAIEKHLHTMRELPKLIFWGEQDFCFNLHFRDRWMKIWPEAELHSYPDASHYLFETAFERIEQAVQGWIKKLDLGEIPDKIPSSTS